MARHRHTFVEAYNGMVAFGFNREVDEKSLMYVLQQFSDDAVLSALVPRLSDEEITGVFGMVTELLRRHFTDEEYHGLFLKDREPPPRR